jgi:hypothetical protein
MTDPAAERHLPAPPDRPAELEVPRHLELVDLPPAVAERVRFSAAAPKRLRGESIPAEVRDQLEALWDGIVADVYDEVAGLRRTRVFNRAVIERVLARVAVRLQQTERALVVTAVHWPLPAEGERRHVATAAAGGAVAAATEEIAVYGGMGVGATVAVTSAILGEVFETYVAASGRTHQYRRAHRSPAPDVVVADLAQALGLGSAVGRRASRELTREAVAWLEQHLLTRTARRFSRSLVPVVGIGVGAGMAGAGVRKALKLPLRPPSEDEVLRIAEHLVREQAYEQDRARFAALDPTGAPPPPPDPAWGPPNAPPPPPPPPPPSPGPSGC